MAWLQANWLYVFTAWCAINAVLSPISAKVPATAWYGKALHVFVAVSPMDVLKAIKAVGSALAVPVAGAAMCLTLALLPGCSLFSTSTPPETSAQAQAKAQAMADATTALLETAWEASAQACLNAANEAKDDTIRQKCEAILTPTRNALLGTQSLVDGWTAADQGNFPCSVYSVVTGFFQLQSAFPSLTLPQSVRDALILSRAFVGQCPAANADGGAS